MTNDADTERLGTVRDAATGAEMGSTAGRTESPGTQLEVAAEFDTDLGKAASASKWLTASMGTDLGKASSLANWFDTDLGKAASAPKWLTASMGTDLGKAASNLANWLTADRAFAGLTAEIANAYAASESLAEASESFILPTPLSDLFDHGGSATANDPGTLEATREAIILAWNQFVASLLAAAPTPQARRRALELAWLSTVSVVGYALIYDVSPEVAKHIINLLGVVSFIYGVRALN